MSDLPTDPFEVTYNGFVFPLETMPLRVSTRPNYDAAGRTVVSTTLSLTVEFYVLAKNGATDVNSTMTRVRNLLTMPAANLRVSGAGFGELDVNRPGGVGQRDVVWGPKPRMLTEEYKGGERAWRCVWTVEVCILDQCVPGTATFRFKTMEFNYRVSYAVGHDGLTTRNYSGHLKVPQTRLSRDDRRLLDNADAYRHLIVPPLIYDYKRRPGTFSLSEDKCTLYFEIVDEQLPSWAPPIWCFEPPSLSHSSRSSIRKTEGFMKWFHTISGEYSIVKGAPREWAWEHFVHYVDRVRSFIKQRQPNAFFITTDLTVAEPEVYGRRSGAFTVTFMHVLAGDLTTVFNDAQRRALLSTAVRDMALWVEPVTNPDRNLDPKAGENEWDEWAQSMEQAGANYMRGISQLTFQNGEDGIVDLCLQDAPKVLRGDPPEGPGLLRQMRPIRPDEAPLANNSWLRYEMRTEVVEGDELMLHKPLGAVRTLSTQPLLHDVGGFQPGNYADQPDHVTQARAAPTQYVVLTGAAARVNYEITPPRLLEYLGVPVLPVNAGGTFQTYAKAVADGNIIVQAYWRLVYVFTKRVARPVSTASVPLIGPMPERSLSTPGGLYDPTTRTT